jgi:hypothetical protein
MSPMTSAQAELALTIARAEQRARQVLHQLTCVPASTHQAHLHDHPTAVAGDMADALNRLEPGMGDRWMQAMYPEVNLSERVL